MREIRYIFHSDAKLFSSDFADSTSAFLNLRTDYDFFKVNDSDFTVKNASLEKRGGEYTLMLSIIPWKTGFISVPPFNLNALVNSSINFSQSKTISTVFTPFIVKLSPIEVKSLAEKTGHKSFMPQTAPLVMEGTTLFLTIIAIIALILFSVLIFILLHIPRVAFFIKNITYLYSLKKNSRKSIKSLLRLKKESEKIPSDKDFAEKLQHIMRDFLSKRFGKDFSSITTSRISLTIEDICGGGLNEGQAKCIENLTALFNRLDYIRFSENAFFLHKNEKEKEERSRLIENACHIIEEFDTDLEEENDSI